MPVVGLTAGHRTPWVTGGIVLVSLILAAYISDQGSSIMSNW